MPDDSPASFLDTPVPEGWDCNLLDDLVDADRGISYGIVQPGKHDDAGVPIVRVNNLRNGRIETNDVLRVSTTIEEKYARTRLRGGEVLLSLVGTLGECAVVPPELRGWNVARAVAVIPIRSDIDPRWVTTCLRSAPLQHLIRTWATTTVQATFNLRDVRRLPIVIPPTATREWMTKVLGMLDDKIELNRRMNELLEGMARAYFKAWFVNFEPVKAKAGGATSFPGMPQPVFDRLPDTFVDSEFGEVPEGWNTGRLGDVIEVHDRRRIPLSKKQRQERRGQIPYYGATGVIDYVDEPIFDGIHVLLGEDGSVVRDDGTPFVQYVWGRYWVNNHAHVLSGANGFGNEHLYLLLQLADIRPFVTGAVQAKLNQKNMCSLPVVIPQTSFLNAFQSIIEPWFSLVRALSDQSTVLVQTRETLLPRLVSGEVAVPATNGGGDG